MSKPRAALTDSTKSLFIKHCGNVFQRHKPARPLNRGLKTIYLKHKHFTVDFIADGSSDCNRSQIRDYGKKKNDEAEKLWSIFCPEASLMRDELLVTQ